MPSILPAPFRSSYSAFHSFSLNTPDSRICLIILSNSLSLPPHKLTSIEDVPVRANSPTSGTPTTPQWWHPRSIGLTTLAEPRCEPLVGVPTREGIAGVPWFDLSSISRTRLLLGRSGLIRNVMAKIIFATTTLERSCTLNSKLLATATNTRKHAHTRRTHAVS